MKRNTIFAVLVAALFFLLPSLAGAINLSPAQDSAEQPEYLGFTAQQVERDSTYLQSVLAKAGVDINYSPINDMVSFPLAKLETRWEAGKVTEYLTPRGAWVDCGTPLGLLGADDNPVIFTGQQAPFGYQRPASLGALVNKGSITLHENISSMGFFLGFQVPSGSVCYHDGGVLNYRGDPNAKGRVFVRGVDYTHFFSETEIVDRAVNIYTLNAKPGVYCRKDGNEEGLRLRISNWTQGDDRTSGTVRIDGDLVTVDGVNNIIHLNAPIVCTGPGQGDAFEFAFNARSGVNGANDPNTIGVFRSIALTPGYDGQSRFWNTDGSSNLQGNWYLPLQVRPLSVITAGSAPVKAGFTTNGGLERLASVLNVTFDPVIPLSGVVDLVNVAGGCPRVAAQSQNRVNIARGEGAQPCTTPGSWNVKFAGANITPLLDATKPVTVDGREVILNLRPPLVTQRCRADQLPSPHAWFLYTSFGGQCYCLGATIYLLRPAVELVPEPFTPGTD